MKMPRLPSLKARPHRKHKDDPPALPALDVEVIDDDDETESSLPAAAPSASMTSSGSYVDDVVSGLIDGSKPESAAIALPTTAETLVAEPGGLERFLDECSHLYRVDEPLLAMRRMQLLEPLVIEAGLQPLRERTHDATIELVLRTSYELDAMLKRLLSDEWTLIDTKKQLKVETWLRMGEGGRTGIKVTGVLPRSVSSMAACLLLPELYPSWIPGVTFATQLRAPSNFRRLVYMKCLKAPIPFLQQRDAVIVGYGTIYSATSVVVYITTVEDDDPLLDGLTPELNRLSPPGKNVRMGIQGGFIFEALGDGTTRLQATIELDIKMQIVPPQLIDWLMRHLAANLIPMWDKQAKKFDDHGKLRHLINEGPEAATYVEMNRRLEVLKTAGEP